MSFGKSRARLHTDERRRVTFADVAGADEAKEELVEVVEFLKQPKKFNDLGAKIPKGVLLFGPPGTGKTLLARAVAGEAEVPFFSISGSDFVEMFVGVGASRVRDLFEQAKKNAPCIVFIDEIDAVGRQRGAGLGGGHDEREQTLNQLLVEMDGFAPNESIIIVAATNRPDILDPALLRPGRFDRQVTVDRPDVVGRNEILKVHIKGKPLADDVDIDVLARRTPGFTGADLANLINEAALLAARFNKKAIGMSELENAIERVIAGPEKKSKVISENEKRLVSFHEAGHALVGYLLPNTDPVHKVSIIPRGRAGGYTLLLPKEDRYYATKSQLLDQVTMLLGGRVAEALALKEISTGAQNDLERATGLVRKMICEFGMSDVLGPLTFGHRSDQVFMGRDFSRDRNYSEEVAKEIDQEVKNLMNQSYEKAKAVLEQNWSKLNLIAETLMEKETLEACEFEKLMKADAV
jgi:cell division protease FtsH